MRDELRVNAALAKNTFGVGLLKITASNFRAGNLSGYRQDRNPAAVGVVESIDQVCVSRSAAPGTNRQLFRQMCFRSGSKGSALLMPDVDPTQQPTSSNGVRDAVERIAGNPIDSLHAGMNQSLHQQFRNILAHNLPRVTLVPRTMLRLSQKDFHESIGRWY